jgi:hypothetical protein
MIKEATDQSVRRGRLNERVEADRTAALAAGIADERALCSPRMAPLVLGDCGSRPNSRCCLLTAPSGTRELTPDRLAVGACKHPRVSARAVGLPGRSSPRESIGRRANRNRSA